MQISRFLLAVVGCVLLSGPIRAVDLRVGVFSEVTTLDPHYFQLTSNVDVDMLIYSTLVSHDVNLKVVPDLAVNWRPLGDLHWEFRLRRGVTWLSRKAMAVVRVGWGLQAVSLVRLYPSRQTRLT